MKPDEIAALIIRSLASGGQSAAIAIGAPAGAAIATGVAGLLGMVASLVERHGRARAEEILAELVSSPARPLSDSDLDDTVARIRGEFTP